MAIATLQSIRLKFRRLTGLLNATQFPDSSIDDYINSFYNYDFPAQFRSLKLKDIYTFNTIQNIDTYPFPSEQYTTVEMPCYCMMREIRLFQDQWSFYGANFNWQFQTNFSFGNGTNGPYSGITSNSPIVRSYNNIPLKSEEITNIEIDTPIAGQATVFFESNPFFVNQTLFFGDIVGTIGTLMNGSTFPIVTSNAFSVVINLNATGTTYTSGGEAFLKPLNFNYPASRLQNVLITANTLTGTLNVSDDGFGNLQGDILTSQPAGTINYQTGAVSGLYFSEPVPDSNAIQIQYNPSVPSIPLAILYFQNQLVLRPVPDRGYTMQITSYRLPSQALMQTPNSQGKPELDEWWETISIGAAKKYYEDQVDFENIALMDRLLMQKYSLNMTRTYAQLGKQRVQTIYQDQIDQNYGTQGGWGWSGGSP